MWWEKSNACPCFRSRVEGCLRGARTLPAHSGETVEEGRDGQNAPPVMDAREDGEGGPRAARDSVVRSRPNSCVASAKYDEFRKRRWLCRDFPGSESATYDPTTYAAAAQQCLSLGLRLDPAGAPHGSDVGMDKYVSSAGSDFQPWDPGI